MEVIDSRWTELQQCCIGDFELYSEVGNCHLFADIEGVHPWRLGGTRDGNQYRESPETDCKKHTLRPKRLIRRLVPCLPASMDPDLFPF